MRVQVIVQLVKKLKLKVIYMNHLVIQPPAMQTACNSGDRVHSLGGEDPLEEEMATHSNILAWEIPQTGITGGVPPMGLQQLDTT